ncbi:MAG: hypothetical protein AB7Q45_21785 [Planctomycetaceae bacterium]
MRLDYDVRRAWRCAVCGAERRTLGDQTAVRCAACADHPLMTLAERVPASRPASRRLDMVIGLHPDDVGSPPYVPAHLRSATVEAEPVPQAAAAEPQPIADAPSPSARDAGRAERAEGRPSRRRSRRRGSEREPPPPPAPPPPQTSMPDSGTVSEPTPGDTPPPGPPPPPPPPVETSSFGDGVLDGS